MILSFKQVDKKEPVQKVSKVETPTTEKKLTAASPKESRGKRKSHAQAQAEASGGGSKGKKSGVCNLS